MSDPARHLVRVVLDDVPGSPDALQALTDLERENDVTLPGHPGPYALRLSVADGRLVFDVRTPADAPLTAFGMAVGPLRGVIRDYGLLLDSYAAAAAEGREARLQAIDMGRRGLHNEGAEILRARLAGRIGMGLGTARRLFTLVCALHHRL